jgi:hypothetical protein
VIYTRPELEPGSRVPQEVCVKNLLTLLFLFFVPSILFAQSRFDGTWEMKTDTLRFSGPPEEYLFDKEMYHCLSCVPKVDVKTDGTDQRVAGYPNYDTLAVRILDSNSVEFTMKKEGKPTFVCTETVSPDGQTMTEEFANTMEAETVTGRAGFTRVGKGPTGSHALSGEWRMDTVRNATRAGTLTTIQTTAEGMRVSDGSQSYEAKFDGTDRPASGDSAPSTASLKRIDDYTIEETSKQDGKAVGVKRMTVSKDGKSMKVTTADKKRGTTMTYTAQKQP